MAGRRRTGAAAAAFANTLSAGLDVELRTRLSEAKERRDFDRRLQVAGITAGIKTGQIVPRFEGGQLRGFAPTTLGTGGVGRLEGLLSQAGQLGLEPTLRFDQFGRVTGGSLRPQREARAREARAPFLPGSQEAQLLGQAQPGQSLPSTREVVGRDFNVSTVNNIPVSPAGVNTLNRAIQAGLTESPAVLGPAMLPPGPIVPGPGGSLISERRVEALPSALLSREEAFRRVMGQGGGQATQPLDSLLGFEGQDVDDSDGFSQSLNNASRAIQSGANRQNVFQRLLRDHPSRRVEIERFLDSVS